MVATGDFSCGSHEVVSLVASGSALAEVPPTRAFHDARIDSRDWGSYWRLGRAPDFAVTCHH